MPRDGSNIYHIPPGTQGSPSTTVASAPYNAFLADIEADQNLARPVVAGGTGAATAAAARTSLAVERSNQVVTNYDTQVWEFGSFSSAAGATNAPVGGHAFSGIVYGIDSNNITVEARDKDDTFTPGLVYVREKIAGVWGSWTADFVGVYVAKSGDSMSGSLVIVTAGTGGLQVAPTSGNARILLDHAASGGNSQITARLGTLNRWQMQLGNTTAESGGNAGADFQLSSFNDAGSLIGNALLISRATMAATFGGTVTAAAKGNLFGAASGTAATGAVTLADANVQLYNISSTNWAGIGTDGSGHMWFKTGTAGTPAPAFYIQNDQFVFVTKDPTSALGVATKQYVDAKIPQLAIAAGTIMLFEGSATAPAQWTKLTNHDDKAIRVVSGTPTPGGSVAFSTVFGRTATDVMTLSTAQIPSHTHSVNICYGAGGTFTLSGITQNTDAVPTAVNANSGGGGSHSHGIDLRVQYLDVIRASKN